MKKKKFVPMDSDETGQEKRNVFIVDDDESVCRALGALLGACGFMVRTFLSAEDFFSAVPNCAPGCLLLDIHMPGLNGWLALKRMINSGSERPVIIISADKNSAPGQGASENEVRGFFHKPINSEELVSAIHAMY